MKEERRSWKEGGKEGKRLSLGWKCVCGSGSGGGGGGDDWMVCFSDKTTENLTFIKHCFQFFPFFFSINFVEKKKSQLC